MISKQILPYRAGSTLLELIVALSLAALLVMAISGVLASLQRKEKSISKQDASHWKHELDRLLWDDFSQAESVGLKDTLLNLSVPTYQLGERKQPALVTYQLAKTPSQNSRLIRAVFREDGQLVQNQTLLWNVRSCIFERVDDQGADQPIPEKMGPVPRAIHYRIEFEEASQSSINHRITVR